MDLNAVLDRMRGCPCGRPHAFDVRAVEIGSGLTKECGRILRREGFEPELLAVADRNTAAASPGLFEALGSAGFRVSCRIYDDMRYARAEQVREIRDVCVQTGARGVLSVGTGSLNDICRVASFRAGVPFAIFATAPSMDGFASNSAPIIDGCFKTSIYVRQPKVIVADTKILADSPAVLKSAGFGDMMAKYIAIADWKIAHLTGGDYYCERTVDLVREALGRISALCGRITDRDEEAAGAVMEALVLSGLAMQLSGNSRPASGSEHIVSHFWECKKLAAGIWPEFHGRKVGVATVLINRVYRNIARRVRSIRAHPDRPDWERIKAVYGPLLAPDVMKVNDPPVTERVDCKQLERSWGDVRRIVLEELPGDEKLAGMMERAGAPTDPAAVNVDRRLLLDGLRFHPYMRGRINLTRLLPMADIDPADFM